MSKDIDVFVEKLNRLRGELVRLADDDLVDLGIADVGTAFYELHAMQYWIDRIVQEVKHTTKEHQ